MELASDNLMLRTVAELLGEAMGASMWANADHQEKYERKAVAFVRRLRECGYEIVVNE
ncbi:MAG TPA: hypothetical protein VG328_17965 [Stellaceae bacterium]|jgi:hypothetical protein|nr:hypothetical protein [Stellaceae bacterium]